MEKEKEEAIARCRRRIDAAINLYKDGEIDRAEYLRIREANEREIVHWENRTTETKELATELALCMEALDRLVRSWERGDPEDRRGLAHNLFEYIVYDLDAQRIVDFRLKPWADRFLTLRAGLYEVEMARENENPTLQEPGTAMPPRGQTPSPSLLQASFDISHYGYPDRAKRDLSERSERAIELHAQGMSYPQIARKLGVSVGTAWNAVNRDKMPE